MATNADEDDTSTAVADDDKEVTEEDLRSLKYGSEEVETSEEEDESTDTDEDEDDSEEAGEEDGQTDDQAEEEETPTFVKQFPNIKGDTPEEYAKNLEAAYNNSTAEALRLKQLAEAKTDTGEEEDKQAPIDTSDVTSLYAKQKMDEEIQSAYADFSKKYSQVNDANEYSRFTNEVAILSNTILQSQKRLASPTELYQKAAIILGWQPEDTTTKAEKVAAAAKNGAATSKTSSATKPVSKSKVTDEMITVNRKMYPGKSDTEIRKELEEHVQ